MTREKKQKPVDAAAALRQMERMFGGAAKGKSRREQDAQQLVYDAWETADVNEACELLEKACQLDPENVDAWLGLLHMSTLPDEEQVDILRQLVEKAGKALGSDFKELKGHFWGAHETRPYMRARQELVLVLNIMGRFQEAITEQEAMLELNPGDNQGIRFGLLANYLAEDRLDDARRLFEEYDERKYSAIMAWGYLLERILAGDLKEAEKALKEANKQNAHAEDYFLWNRSLPQNSPGSYALGSQEEAIVAWEILQPAWNKHPVAGDWLRSQRKVKD